MRVSSSSCASCLVCLLGLASLALGLTRHMQCTSPEDGVVYWCVWQGELPVENISRAPCPLEYVPMCPTEAEPRHGAPKIGCTDGTCLQSRLASESTIRAIESILLFTNKTVVIPVNTNPEITFCVLQNIGFTVFVRGGDKNINIPATDYLEPESDTRPECKLSPVKLNYMFTVSGNYTVDIQAGGKSAKNVTVQVLPSGPGQAQPPTTTLSQPADPPPSEELFSFLVSLLEVDCAAKRQARENLLLSSFQDPLQSSDEAQTMAKRLNALTSKSTDLTPGSQTAALDRLVTLSTFLDSQAQRGQSLSATVEVSRLVMSTVSNVLEAFQLTRERSGDTAYQEEALKDTFQVLDSVSDAVQAGIATGSESTVLQSESVNVTLKKCDKDVAEDCLQIPNCTNCFYPELPAADSLPPNAALQVGIYEFDSDPYAWAPGGGNMSTSVTSVRMLAVGAKNEKTELPVETFEIIMTNKENISAMPVVLRPKDSNGLSTIQAVELTWSEFTDYFVQFSAPHGVHFLVNVSLPDYDDSISCTLPSSAQSQCNLSSLEKPKHPYVLPVPQPSSLSDGDLFIATFSVFTASPGSHQNNTLTLEVTVFSATCLDFDGQQNSWTPATCAVGSQVTKDQVHCVCSPGSRSLLKSFPRSLAAKVFVAPNLIDLSTLLDRLKTLKQNFATVSMAGTIVFLYLCLVAVGLKRYKKDEIHRDRAIILADNDPYDKMIYLLTTYTGSRRRAGTSANVYVRLRGSDGVSEHHVLNQHEPVTFMRGDINTFLVTAAHDLGELESIDIWHDNSGPSPDWYLSRVKVVHFYSKREWYFMCRTWLRPQGPWGRFVVLTPEDRLTPGDYFQMQILFSLYDSSLWFSVFSRVVPSFFNRLERLSCCVSLDMTGLLLNLIFLRSQNFDSVPERDLLQTVIVSLQCAVILMVLHAILFTLFQISHQDQEAAMQKPLVAPSDGEWPDWDLTVRPLTWLTSEELQRQMSGKRSQGAKCCQAIAFILVVALIAISFVFISIYGLYYTPKESLTWVYTSILSFFQSLFIVQPLKCLIFTALHAFAKKHASGLSWPGRGRVVKADHKMLPCAIEKRRLHVVLKMLRRTKLYDIPPELRRKPTRLDEGTRDDASNPDVC
ncbi:PKDRE protein, partial [Polypterus senegalus]|nr:PKDRE protein [Polypterus senegalus]